MRPFERPFPSPCTLWRLAAAALVLWASPAQAQGEPPPPPPLPAPPGKVLVPADSPPAPAAPVPVPTPVSLVVIEEIKSHIDAVRKSGERLYSPESIYVVDPSTQRMHIVDAKTYQLKTTLLTGTGSNGVGFKDGQTPPGFYTMGGVRIAKNGSASIQTGDTRSGVSGVYAELLYPPTHEDPSKRGKVPINVVIHSFNPEVSDMLRRRHEDGLIGKVPCTTGCPVIRPQDTTVLAPYLKQSAGQFDPGTKPGKALRSLIRSKQVTEHTHRGLGDPIFIIQPNNPTTSSP